MRPLISIFASGPSGQHLRNLLFDAHARSGTIIVATPRGNLHVTPEHDAAGWRAAGQRLHAARIYDDTVVFTAEWPRVYHYGRRT